jgi:hypothetical protein
MYSFRALSLSLASSLSSGLVSLLLEVGFWLPLKAGMKNCEPVPKQALSKIGILQELNKAE